MSGKLTGLVARIKEIIPSVWLGTIAAYIGNAKKIPEELKQTLDESVKIVNVIDKDKIRISACRLGLYNL